MAIDHQTFVALMLRKRTSLLAFIRAIVRDEHLAEDVFQEAISVALTSIDQIRDEEHWFAWMRRAARHRALNALRQRKRFVFDSAVIDQLEAEWADEGSFDDPDRVALRACIGKLTSNAQSLLRLRYSERLSGEHLAAAVHRNLNTVYVALSRIHRTLKECVETARRKAAV
jgi:RNA polymerase sigma-70 factor (ECF subfamily)